MFRYRSHSDSTHKAKTILNRIHDIIYTLGGKRGKVRFRENIDFIARLLSGASGRQGPQILCFLLKA